MDEMKCLLRAGARYRFCSLLFRYPSEDVISAASALVDTFAPEVQRDASELVGLMASAQARTEYHFLLGSGGSVSPYESAYQADGSARDKGAVLGDVAGFYRAFDFEHMRDAREAPDHVAVELAFLSFLKLKAAYALMNRDEGAHRICRDAEERFLDDHLSGWLPEFLKRIGERAASEFYRRAARLTTETQKHRERPTIGRGRRGRCGRTRTYTG